MNKLINSNKSIQVKHPKKIKELESFLEAFNTNKSDPHYTDTLNRLKKQALQDIKRLEQNIEELKKKVATPNITEEIQQDILKDIEIRTVLLVDAEKNLSPDDTAIFNAQREELNLLKKELAEASVKIHVAQQLLGQYQLIKPILKKWTANSPIEEEINLVQKYREHIITLYNKRTISPTGSTFDPLTYPNPLRGDYLLDKYGSTRSHNPNKSTEAILNKRKSGQ